ncbi:MFS transporter [Rummeliibacillus sp. NPDC094406]|uniref:MFS transporter n=1 Tax=Rummeliibacillus sp. NPDC094406 TaxID=3364511 RepID=UPI0038193361
MENINNSFKAIWLSSATSELGGAFFTFCNSVLIYKLTGSPTKLGLVWLIYYVPSFFMQLFIGPYIDRWSRKRTMIICHLIRAFLALTLSVSLIGEFFSISLIFLVQVIVGIVMPIFTPANQAILPTIIEKEQLGKANATLESIRQVMAIMGPILAGIAVEFIEVKWLLLVIGFAFLISTYALSKISENFNPQQIRKPWLTDFKEGLHSYFDHPLIVWLGVFFGFVQFGVGVTTVTTLPFITTVLDLPYTAYGLFMAGFPVGYILGALLNSKLSKNKDFGILFSSLFIGGCTYISLSLTPWYFLAIITECIAGIVIAIFNINNITLIQQSIPNHVMGKVTSVRLLIMRIMLPLGILCASFCVEFITIRGLYFIIGTIICGTSVFGYLYLRHKSIKSYC